MMEPRKEKLGPIAKKMEDLSRHIRTLEETLTRLKSLDMDAKELMYIFSRYAETIEQGLVLTQDGIMIWANSAANRIMGFKLNEVINKPMVEFAPPEVRQQMSARLATVQVGDGITATVSWPLLTKTGSTKIIKGFSYRVIYMGQPGVLTFFYDVTEEMKMQEDLAMRAGLLELVSELVFVLDPGGKIIYANKSMCESLGYKKDEMIGRSILEFHNQHDAKRVKTRLESATPVSHGKYITAYVCKDGHIIPASSVGQVINLNGTEYILGVARPIDPHDAPI
jgi:PAS domain S-box-containing protein